MYRLDKDDSSGDAQDGAIKGGETFWGVIAGLVKNMGLKPDYILWGTSWINLMMMSYDMPYWKADGQKLNTPIETKDDFEEFLN